MGRIYMIMGKSASGKDHIYHSILEDKTLGLNPLILYTTRPKRRGEKNGREYYFTDLAHLASLREAGKIIEERVYPTVHGDWYYFLADEGQIDLDKLHITIGTLQSYVKMKQYFGEELLAPLYIESDPYLRLQRAIGRERKQKKPEYKEVCRRFLADEEDFSEEKLQAANITKRFSNNSTLAECIREVKDYIQNSVKHRGT